MKSPKDLVAITTAAAVFTAAAAGAFLARLGDVDRQSAAIHLFAIEGCDGLLRLFGGAHGHEAEPAGTLGRAIHHQVGFSDRAMRGERVLQVVFGGIEGKVSNKQFITHVMLYCPTNRYFLGTVPERRV